MEKEIRRTKVSKLVVTFDTKFGKSVLKNGKIFNNMLAQHLKFEFPCDNVLFMDEVIQTMTHIFRDW
ncbi:hypothetical protein PanWU01x14_014120 [Parasponia andersonii]|uniref:Uncharacterized protein n=1 Tax=Parasponia andersonii TaxID=3476 RepID=A0A2P5E196_PARAD|nr:hypothetical protein PanWU01x14_014120 [Parasponia andersonii]